MLRSDASFRRWWYQKLKTEAIEWTKHHLKASFECIIWVLSFRFLFQARMHSGSEQSRIGTYHPFAYSLAPLIQSLVPYCLLRSRDPLRSLVCWYARSLTPKLLGKFTIGCLKSTWLRPIVRKRATEFICQSFCMGEIQSKGKTPWHDGIAENRYYHLIRSSSIIQSFRSTFEAHMKRQKIHQRGTSKWIPLCHYG